MNSLCIKVNLFMKDSAQLTTETLTESLRLNQAAQQSLLQDAAARADDRAQLVAVINKARANAFEAIGAYKDMPTETNKRRLTEFRRDEVLAERALQDFDLAGGQDDMHLLVESERTLKAKLKTIRMSEGAGSLQAEFDGLKEKLKTDLPRLLALNSVIHNVPPGILDVEKFMVKQLNFRRTYESGYQKLLHELDFSGEQL